MAKYHITKDGEPYLTHGYPILDEHGNMTGRFCTYKLYPYAVTLLREAGFPEEGSLPLEVFYALLVEESLYNKTNPHGVPITNVPWSVWSGASDFERSNPELLESIENIKPRPKFVLDVYRILIDLYPNLGNDQLLSHASWLSLARHVKASDGVRPSYSGPSRQRIPDDIRAIAEKYIPK